MDIYLGTLRFPVPPEELSAESDGQSYTYRVIDLGDIDLPRGRKPRKLRWQSFFPGPARAGLPVYIEAASPTDYLDQIDAWIATNAILGLVVTEVGLAFDVSITSFRRTAKGGHGDIHYEIGLTEYRPLRIGSTDVPEGTLPGPVGPTPDSYTVTEADTSLWEIAKRVWGDGSRWRDILTANVAILEGDPDSLAPGMVLRIPGSGTQRPVVPVQPGRPAPTPTPNPPPPLSAILLP